MGPAQGVQSELWLRPCGLSGEVMCPVAGRVTETCQGVSLGFLATDRPPLAGDDLSAATLVSHPERPLVSETTHLRQV